MGYFYDELKTFLELKDTFKVVKAESGTFEYHRLHD